jgi:hypothetical protein
MDCVSIINYWGNGDQEMQADANQKDKPIHASSTGLVKPLHTTLMDSRVF